MSEPCKMNCGCRYEKEVAVELVSEHGVCESCSKGIESFEVDSVFKAYIKDYFEIQRGESQSITLREQTDMAKSGEEFKNIQKDLKNFMPMLDLNQDMLNIT